MGAKVSNKVRRAFADRTSVLWIDAGDGSQMTREIRAHRPMYNGAPMEFAPCHPKTWEILYLTTEDITGEPLLAPVQQIQPRSKRWSDLLSLLWTLGVFQPAALSFKYLLIMGHHRTRERRKDMTRFLIRHLTTGCVLTTMLFIWFLIYFLQQQKLSKCP